jgi:hypothetical protein
LESGENSASSGSRAREMRFMRLPLVRESHVSQRLFLTMNRENAIQRPFGEIWTSEPFVTRLMLEPSSSAV